MFGRQNRFPSLKCTIGVAALALFLVAGSGARAWADDAGVHAAGSSAKTGKGKPSVTDNIKTLKNEITDPNTPKRIKSHEQEAETRVERTRDGQRKDHGQAKPGDMVDVVKKMDDPDAGGPTSTTAIPGKTTTKTEKTVKVETKTTTTKPKTPQSEAQTH